MTAEQILRVEFLFVMSEFWETSRLRKQVPWFRLAISIWVVTNALCDVNVD